MDFVNPHDGETCLGKEPSMMAAILSLKPWVQPSIPQPWPPAGHETARTFLVGVGVEC